MPEEQSLNSKVNPQGPIKSNPPKVKRETLIITIWFLSMLVILAFPWFLLSTWANMCAAELKFYGTPQSFGCDNILHFISSTALTALAGVAVLFAIASFIKKTPNQFFIILYLIIAAIVILPVLIMLGGNLSFFQ